MKSISTQNAGKKATITRWCQTDNKIIEITKLISMESFKNKQLIR